MTDQPYTPVNTDPAPAKKSRKGTIIGSVVGLVAGIIIGAAAGGSSTPAPTAGATPTATVTATATVEVPGPTETVTELPEVTATTEAATSTCADAREAFLTGTPADITRTLKALQADKSADQTAREYANYYLGRDKGDASMQNLDKGLIQSACGLF